MDIHFECPHCGQNLSVEGRGAGLRVNCPKCNEPIEIPRTIAPTTPIPIAIPATATTAVDKTEPLAIWSLVLGIVSLFSCGLILGIPSVICGHSALSNIRKNPRSGGRGLAVAGLTIGYVSVALWSLLILGWAGLQGNRAAVDKAMRVYADMQTIKTQLQIYESMNGFYPTTEQGLQALVTQPQTYPLPTRWSQYLRELPKDPWGSDYIYRCPGVKNPGGYDLFSAGPDRKPDTADDDWGGP